MVECSPRVRKQLTIAERICGVGEVFGEGP